MTNPLLSAKPASQTFDPIERHGPTYAHDLARHYNERLTRTDIEWCVSDADQLYLRDKPEATRARTEQMAKRAENERQEWMRNNERRV